MSKIRLNGILANIFFPCFCHVNITSTQSQILEAVGRNAGKAAE